jgi:hypothetical protein
MVDRKAAYRGEGGECDLICVMSEQMRIAFLAVATAFGMSACAGLNPNPGERTTDMALVAGKYGRPLRSHC